jgi:uncharacterized protein YndB with AHSA1/START domain
MEITARRTIRAPIDVVFGVFADIEHAADHLSGIEAIEIVSDVRLGLGTRWRETRMMFGRPTTEEMEITEFEPPTRYSVGSDSRGTRYQTVFEFAEGGGEGVTEATMIFGGRPVSIGARLLSPLAFVFAGQVRKMIEADMDDLVVACEAVDR